MGKPEGIIETYLYKQANKHDILCYKFTAPSTAGVPDRILIGNNKTVFVELKRPGAKPRKLQVAIHNKMREHGAVVFVADTKTLVDEIIDFMLKTE